MLSEPTMVGRFEEHTLPNGEVLYKEHRGDNHYYHAEIKPSKSAKGGYSFVKGSTLTGVTTAAKHLDGDATGLMHWAAEHDQKGVARIASADLDAGFSLDWLRSQETIKERLVAEAATWEHERDRRSDQGTNVHHETVWKLATGQDASLSDLADDERGFGQAVFRSFQTLGLRGKVRHAEQVTADLSNGIAGTFDVWAAEVEVARLACPNVRGSLPEAIRGLDTFRLLADYKTRDRSGKVRKSDHAQVRGYEYCNSTCGIEESDAQAVILALPDGEWELYWCDAERGDWLASMNACRAGKQVDSRMRATAKVEKEAAEAVLA